MNHSSDELAPAKDTPMTHSEHPVAHSLPPADSVGDAPVGLDLQDHAPDPHAQLVDETVPTTELPTPFQPPAFIPTVADLEEALRDVVDPELGINIVDLGLVYGVTIDAQAHCVVDMTLTSAACPLTDVIEDQTAMALGSLVASHRINWVWMPPWGPDKITDDGREQLRALGFNL